jgi:hypothetical protein
MVSKCANPACSAPFRYFRHGKLFRVGTGHDWPRKSRTLPALKLVSKHLPKYEHFWLCGPCSTKLTFDYQEGHGVVLLPLNGAKRAAAS